VSVNRVVILGASGYIGGALARTLAARGIEVIGHSSKTLDLRHAEAFAVLDGVVDADTALVVASALTPDRGQNPDTLVANVAMVANVSRYLERHPVGQCVYVSSDAVYGFDVNPVDETTPVALGGHYALAKYTGEKLLQFTGVPLLILRVSGVYGPGDPHGAYGPNAFTRSLARDRSLRLFGAGEEERDHVYIDDVAQVMASLLGARATGILNVATGESRTFADVVATIRALVPYDVPVTSAPRKGAITHRRYDITRLRQAIPDMRFTPFKEGLRATLAAFGAL